MNRAEANRAGMIPARKVIWLAYCGWKRDNLNASKDAMRRYCEYISMRGYRGGATNAMDALDSFSSKRKAARWIQSTFDKYVTNQVDCVEYVLDTVCKMMG